MLIIAAWTTPAGDRTSPLLPAARTEAEAERQVRDAIARARRERGTDVRVQVVDDRTGRVVLNVTPKSMESAN